MERKSESLVTASDILDVDRMEISPHAFERFHLRADLGLIDAAEQIRARLASAVLIEKHARVILNRRKKSSGKVYFFQDLIDRDLVFVVHQRDQGQSYRLATALHPLRRQHKTPTHS